MEPEPVNNIHVGVVIIPSFYARSDVLNLYDQFQHCVETLALVSMHAIKYEYKNTDGCNPSSCTITILDPKLAFCESLPTLLQDKDWENVITNVSKFLNENDSQILKILKSMGHTWEPNREIYNDRVYSVAKKMVEWVDSCYNGIIFGQNTFDHDETKISQFMCTGTASSDWIRLNNLMNIAGRLSPPYNKNGKYGGIKQFNYRQIESVKKALLDKNDKSLKEYKQIKKKIKSMKNRYLNNDVYFECLEMVYCILWMIVDGRISSLVNTNFDMQHIVLYGRDADLFYNFFNQCV